MAALAAAVTVFGPLAFVLLRLFYSEFYEPFGLVPEDLGLDPTHVVTTSLPAFVLAFAGWAFVWCVVLLQLAVLLAFVGGRVDPSNREAEDADGVARGASTLEAVILTVVLAVAGASAAIQISATTAESTGFKVLAGILATAGPVVAWLVRSSARGRAAQADRARAQEDSSARKRARARLAARAGLARSEVRWLLAAGAIVLGVFWAGGTLSSEVTRIAEQDSLEVRLGTDVSKPEFGVSPDFVSLPALDIQAAVADVQWLEGRPRGVGRDDCLVYLGSSDGTAFLWNVSRRPLLLQVPTSTVVIAITKARSCGDR